jgi:hypothetical protein
LRQEGEYRDGRRRARWWRGGGERLRLVRRRRGGEEREGKAQPDDDATPRERPILKAVVASQDLGAAGTEFERS